MWLWLEEGVDYTVDKRFVKRLTLKVGTHEGSSPCNLSPEEFT